MIQALFLALANRCRGGLIKVSSGQLGRLFWGAPFGLTLFFGPNPAGTAWQVAYAIALIFAAWGGACLAAWGKYDTIPTAWNPWKLTLQGLLFVAPPAIVISLASVWLEFNGYSLACATLCSGLAIAPCYWLGWKIPSAIKGLETGIPISELIFGFIIGLSIYIGGIL